MVAFPTMGTQRTTTSFASVACLQCSTSHNMPQHLAPCEYYCSRPDCAVHGHISEVVQNVQAGA
eukprot:2736535-Amphidinium_carterae.1